MFDRQCDGTCATSLALGKLNDELRMQLTEATRTLLSLVDAKAYRIRYPTERQAQPVPEAEPESMVYNSPMSMADIQRAAEEADKLDVALRLPAKPRAQ